MTLAKLLPDKMEELFTFIPKPTRTAKDTMLKKFAKVAMNWQASLTIKEKGNSPAQRVELRYFRICFL